MRPELHGHDDVRALGALAREPDAAPGVDASRQLHLVALALDVDDAAGAVERLLEGELRGGLDLAAAGAARAGAGRARAAPVRRLRRARSRTAVRPVAHLAQQLVEVQLGLGRAAAAATAGGRLGAGGRAREEGPEEVREAGVAAARRVELVADAAR